MWAKIAVNSQKPQITTPAMPMLLSNIWPSRPRRLPVITAPAPKKTASPIQTGQSLAMMPMTTPKNADRFHQETRMRGLRKA